MKRGKLSKMVPRGSSPRQDCELWVQATILSSVPCSHTLGVHKKILSSPNVPVGLILAWSLARGKVPILGKLLYKPRLHKDKISLAVPGHYLSCDSKVSCMCFWRNLPSVLFTVLLSSLPLASIPSEIIVLFRLSLSLMASYRPHIKMD